MDFALAAGALAAASCHLATLSRRHDVHGTMAPYSDITEPAIVALSIGSMPRRGAIR